MAYKITYGENRKKLTDEVHKQRILNAFDGNVIALTPYIDTRTKVTYKCLKHDYIWEGRPNMPMHGSTGCKYCKHDRRIEILSDTLDSVKQKIYDKYGDEYEITDTEYWGHEYKMNFIHHLPDGSFHTLVSLPSRILADSGCPVCSGMQISKGFNDIATTDPEIASWFVNEEETFIYSKHSNVKVNFKCPTCGHILNKSLNQVSKDRDIRCPICKDGISYPNKFIFNSLLQIEDKLNVLKREYRPDWCKFTYKGTERRGIYDIYFEINNKAYIVEMDGGFHKKYNNMNGQTIADSQYIDSRKDFLAIEHGIEIIRIDCCYNNYDDRFEYIMKNINNSIIPSIVPIELIDFEDANRKSQNSLLVDACRLWDKGYKASEIINELRIPECSVSTYLKVGQKYGLCHDYSAHNSYLRSMSREIYCITTDMKFRSFVEANKYYGYDSGEISKCCNGKRDYSGTLKDGTKLFWAFYDDYKKMSSNQINEIKHKAMVSDNQVICLNNTKIFKNALQAAQWCGLSRSDSILKCCKHNGYYAGHNPENINERLCWMYYREYIEKNGTGGSDISA